MFLFQSCFLIIFVVFPWVSDQPLLLVCLSKLWLTLADLSKPNGSSTYLECWLANIDPPPFTFLDRILCKCFSLLAIMQTNQEIMYMQKRYIHINGVYCWLVGHGWFFPQLFFVGIYLLKCLVNLFHTVKPKIWVLKFMTEEKMGMCTCVHSCMCMYVCAVKDKRCRVLPSLSLDSLETDSLTEPEAQALSSTQLHPTYPAGPHLAVLCGYWDFGLRPSCLCSKSVHIFTHWIHHLFFCCLPWWFGLVFLFGGTRASGMLDKCYAIELHTKPTAGTLKYFPEEREEVNSTFYIGL